MPVSFPWGRVSFDMLMSSIKERKEVSLAQNTIALKGFIMSLQLVMVGAVPSLREVVQDGSSSGSKTGCRDEDESLDDEKFDKRSISPGHARDTDADGKVWYDSVKWFGFYIYSVRHLSKNCFKKFNLLVVPTLCRPKLVLSYQTQTLRCKTLWSLNGPTMKMMFVLKTWSTSLARVICSPPHVFAVVYPNLSLVGCERRQKLN